MNQFRVITLLLIILPILSFGQTQYGDSLQALITSVPDTQKVFYFSEIGWEYMTVGKHNEAIKYANDGISLAEKIGYLKGKADCYNLLGANANQQGNQVAAIQFHEKALEIRTKSGDKKGIAASLNNIGNVNNYIGNYEKALEYFLRVYDIQKVLKDSANIATTLNNISISNYYQGRFEEAIKYILWSASIREKINDPKITSTYSNISAMYREMGNHQKSEEYALLSLKVAEKNKDKMGMASAYVNIGTIARNKGDYNSALNYLRKSQAIYQEADYAYGLLNAIGNIARVFEQMNQLDSASFYLQKSIQIAENTNNNTGLIDNLSTYSDILIKQKKYNEAVSVLSRGEGLCRSTNNMNDLRDILGKLCVAYSLTGDYKSAFNYSRLQIHLTDSLFTEDLNAKVTEMDTRFEVQRIESENLKLEQQNLYSELEAKSAKNKLYVLSGIAVLLILSGALIFIRIRSQQKIKLANEISRQQKLGISAVIEAQELERKRIAQELHDSIGQQLSALKMRLHPTAEVDSLLSKTITEVRSISHQMLPVTLQKFGLIPALEELLQQSLSNSSVKYSFEHKGLDNRPMEKVELAVYRVCQEILNNTLKHSQASILSLQLYQTKNNLVLVTEDNGKGMTETDLTKAGMGIYNMKARISNINGEMNFESNPKGLITTIRIPIAS